MSPLDKAQLTLTEVQKQVLNGICLGDATLTPIKKGRENSHLAFNQTAQSAGNVAYYFLAYGVFRNVITDAIGYTTTRSYTGRSNQYYKLNTLALPVFNAYRAMYYNSSGVKIVPYNVAELLTPLALAHLIMCDGHCAGSALALALQGFTYQQKKLIALSLTKNYDIRCSVVTDKKTGKHHILIFAESMNLVRTLVVEHMVPKMLYKVDTNFVKEGREPYFYAPKATSVRPTVFNRTITGRSYFLSLFYDKHNVRVWPINVYLTLPLIAQLFMQASAYYKDAGIELGLEDYSKEQVDSLLL